MVVSQRAGVDIERLIMCQPDSGEMALEVVDNLVRSGAVDIIVIDSVAALVPRAEIEGEIGAVQGEPLPHVVHDSTLSLVIKVLLTFTYERMVSLFYNKQQYSVGNYDCC